MRAPGATKAAPKPAPASRNYPLTEPDYVDNAIRAVSRRHGDYVLHWTAGGKDYSAVLPVAWIFRGPARTILNGTTIYANRTQALDGLVPLILDMRGAQVYVGFWRNEAFPFIVPTTFNEESTPRIMSAIAVKDEDMRRAALEAADQLESLATGMLIGKGLGIAYSGANNPRFYRFLDPKPLAVPVVRAKVDSINATGLPVYGDQSVTPPPISGAQSSTTYSLSEAQSGTRPPLPGSSSASSAQRGTTPQSQGTKVTPMPGSPNGALESAGASQRGPSFVSATAQTARSTITSVRADVAESQAYITALQRGEIGLQRPGGSNVPGVDFITAAVNPQTSRMEVIVTDVKASTIGRFPTPATTVKPTWMLEVQDAVRPGRLQLNDPVLEARIRQAVTNGDVVMRQIEVDYSPTPKGQGSMRGFGPPPGPPVPVIPPK